ncbi:hypothetical protein HK104_007137 [Borealophlyctis nickersoniae]|nr:hypothetical protein HK104_007137 [Borealophlyctis nickersoniae]
MARYVWIFPTIPPAAYSSSSNPDTNEIDDDYLKTNPLSPHAIENGQRGCCNVLLAFAVATKHYLRNEHDWWTYDNLYPLLSHIPAYNVAHLASTGTVPSRIPDLPLELTHHIAAYIDHLRTNSLIDVSHYSLLTNSLSSLTETLTTLERIQSTPIPLAYSIHLSQTVILFLLALPFQLVIAFGWGTVLAVIMASFTLLGIEAIGEEIEDPFGYDKNDLPVDLYCESVMEEVEMLLRFRRYEKGDTGLGWGVIKSGCGNGKGAEESAGYRSGGNHHPGTGIGPQHGHGNVDSIVVVGMHTAGGGGADDGGPGEVEGGGGGGGGGGDI